MFKQNILKSLIAKVMRKLFMIIPLRNRERCRLTCNVENIIFCKWWFTRGRPAAFNESTRVNDPVRHVESDDQGSTSITFSCQNVVRFYIAPLKSLRVIKKALFEHVRLKRWWTENFLLGLKLEKKRGKFKNGTKWRMLNARIKLNEKCTCGGGE